MLVYPQIDPVIFSIGPLKVHWYGLMYLLGFSSAWFLGKWQAKQSHFGWREQQVDDLIFYGSLGAILGGRIGYMIFYHFPRWVEDPLSLFRVWEGGMSFHGGLLGVMVALFLFARKYQLPFVVVADFAAPLVPPGLAFGRMGNFINGELWGKVTDLPWGMVFSTGGALPRHPSQLYECLFEGVFLFLIVWFYRARPRPWMATSGVFLLGYGLIRFSIEFVREPDVHLGYLAWNWLTTGQLLSMPMMLGGALMIFLAYHKRLLPAHQ